MTKTSCNLRSKNLAIGLAAGFALLGLQTAAFASVLAVTSCADDNSTGTLRRVAATAVSGDEINVSALSCSNNTIALTQGELVLAHNASLVGSAGNVLTITNSGTGRVLHSTSSDALPYLDIINVNVSGGHVVTTSDSADGGCIQASGDVTLTGSTVSSCSTSSSAGWARGGAIYAQSVNLASSRVTGSSASSNGSYQIARGGGIYSAALTCSDSTVSGNSTSAASPWSDRGGGAIVVGGNVDLNRCTIDSNTSSEGGGISQLAISGSPSHTIVQNTTVSSNTATLAFGGIEVSCTDCTPATVQISNSTVAFNVSGVGFTAGLFSTGSVAAQSSILADNQNTQNGNRANNTDLSASSLTGANNLIVSTDASHAAGVITITSDPLLMALANNGGSTRTHALAPTSPALNQGNNASGFTTDQRGGTFSRSVSGATDIGAYQHQLNGTRH